MVVRDIRTNQEDHIRTFEILVGAWRAVGPERALVAGDRRGHAERRVAVVLARTDAELYQLAERVELFGHELTRADHTNRFRTVRRLHLSNFAGHGLESDIPADPLLPTRPARSQPRVSRARADVEDLVFRKSLRTERPSIDRMIRIATNTDRASVLDPDEHPATHRTVSARCRNPPLGDS